MISQIFSHQILNFSLSSRFSHRSLGRLKDLVAEHLDHLHYLNDILCLRIDNLNEVLTLHLLNRLFIPLYIYSLVRNPVASSSLEVKYTFSSTFYKTLLNFIFCFANYFPCCAKKNPKKTGLVLLQLDYTTRKFFCSSMIVSFRTFKHQTYVLWLDTHFLIKP